MAVATPRPSRADAVRSRAAIVEAAATLFAHEGARAPLDRVAELAGVGSATLHRHFSGRAELLAAVVGRVTERLAEQGREEFTSSDDGDALWRWLDTIIRHCAQDRSIVDAASRSDPDAEATWSPLLGAGEPLLKRARADGTVDPSVDLVDLLRLVNAIAPAARGDPDDAARLLRMIRRGLDPRPTSS